MASIIRSREQLSMIRLQCQNGKLLNVFKSSKAHKFSNRYDFYMVSQLVRQGTVSPTYYNVIHDEFYAARPEIMQAMTYKLCHLYFNWSGTTRIPSVVQYAKKLAFLVGQFTHETPSLKIPIQNQLYFL
jgi:aubergine